MTQKQKRNALIAVIVALIVLLFLLRRGGTTVVNNSDMPNLQVDIPSFTLPPHTGLSIVIPGLPSGTQYDFNAVSPCMCDGTIRRAYNPSSGPTLVFNEGNSGANVYNYLTSGGSSSGSCPPYYEEYSYLENGRYHTGCRPMGNYGVTGR